MIQMERLLLFQSDATFGQINLISLVEKGEKMLNISRWKWSGNFSTSPSALDHISSFKFPNTDPTRYISTTLIPIEKIIGVTILVLQILSSSII